MKPRIILLGRGEWACGTPWKRRPRGVTHLRSRGIAFGMSPSAAFAAWVKLHPRMREGAA